LGHNKPEQPHGTRGTTIAVATSWPYVRYAGHPGDLTPEPSIRVPSLGSVVDQEDAQIERSALLAIRRSLVPEFSGVFRARWRDSGPVDEAEQPLARHQFCRSARQPVRANGHEALLADVEGLLAEASLRKP